MIVALAANLSQYWEEQVRVYLADQAVMLSPEAGDLSEFVRAVRVSLIVFGMEALTEQAVEQHRQLRQEAPRAVFVCLAPRRVIEQIRTENLLVPDFWLRPEDGPADLAEVLRRAVTQAELAARVAPAPVVGPSRSPSTTISAPEDSVPASKAFERLMAGLTGGLSEQRLLSTYLDAVAEFVRSGSYCLLWWEEGEDRYAVYQAHGLRPEIVSDGRLQGTDALPTWYRRNRRVLTREELAGWSDVQTASELAREMEFFSGDVVVPLMVHGQLAGLLILGEQVIGSPYSPAQLETLFLLSNYVVLALEELELTQQLRRSKAYIERIVLNMSTGVITIGVDQRISVCNPYAAEVLGIERSQIEGADLRALPSPLGDYLYAALTVPEEAITGQEVTIWQGKLTLRVSTSALVDDDGTPLGAVLLMEDLTAEVNLAKERHRGERLKILTGLVGHLVHEIRTPLTAIRTYAELMGDAESDGDLAEFWKNTVTPEIQRLDELARDLVRVVQQPEPEFEVAQIDKLVGEALDKLRGTRDIHESLVKLGVGEAIPRVVVEPQTMVDAIFYLLRYLYGPGGMPVDIDIAASPTDDGESVLVKMSRAIGSEKGLSPEDLFDPVAALQRQQADLGPAISRKIIENQQGRVEAHCEDDKLEIRVVLPAAAIHRTVAP